MGFKELLANVSTAQSAYHQNPVAENAKKVKAAQAELHSYLTKGAVEHDFILPGTILGAKRYANKHEFIGSYFEIGGANAEKKTIIAVGESVEEAVDNWNKKIFVEEDQ